MAGREVIHAREHAGGEALVVAEVEVSLGTVVEDVNFAMLVGRHCAGIDIQIGVKFLHQRGQAAMLKESADGCGSEAFAK